MTLKEKLNEKLSESFANEIEQIAEEFAIGFAEWLYTLIERFGIMEYRRNYMNKSKKQLLKIYKQEKLL